MFISYIFTTTISVKIGLECDNESLKLRNLIEYFWWRWKAENLAFWIEPQANYEYFE